MENNMVHDCYDEENDNRDDPRTMCYNSHDTNIK